jgi:hypothetical protein
MRTAIFQIDAFTTRRFAGNPEASRREGEIICRLVGDRVELEGACVFYLEGEAEI